MSHSLHVVSDAPAPSEKKYLHDCSVDSLKSWLDTIGEKPFRAKQIEEWVWAKKMLSAQEMTNLPPKLRCLLERDFIVSPLVSSRIEESEDRQTTKFLWKLHDGAYVESVLIRAPDRNTVCVSSQVGCPARCGFCASGRKGLIRNLSSAEIITQVIAIEAHLMKTEGSKITNVVYMGMGEPFKNYENVVASIRQLVDPARFGMSPRRITVSTVGVVEGIVAFSKEDLKVNLVLSLHAPNQAIRQKLIPYARQYDLSTVLEAMELYHKTAKRDVTYEYTLIRGINDSEENARELALLLRGRQCTVNLIPYNPVPGLRLNRPETSAIEAFRHVLDSFGVINTCRYTKGVDIAAACGQLALKQESA